MTPGSSLRITTGGAWLAGTAPLIGFACGLFWEVSDSVPGVLWVFPVGAAAAWSARLLPYLADERRTLFQRLPATAAMAAVVFCSAVLGAFLPFAAAWGGRGVDDYGGYYRSWDTTLFERLFVALALGAVSGAATAAASGAVTTLAKRRAGR